MRVITWSVMNNDIPILNVWSVLFLISKLGVFYFDSLESDYGRMRCYVMMDFWFFYMLRMLCLLCLWSGVCSLLLIWIGIISVIFELDLGNWIVMNASLILSQLCCKLLALWWTLKFRYIMCQLLCLLNLIGLSFFDSLESDYG